MLRKIMSLSVLSLIIIGGCGRDGVLPGPGTEVVLLPSDLTSTVSPDGKYVVFFHISTDTSETTGLYILDLETGEKTLLLSGEVSNPDFSPDGRWLVFNVGDQIFKVRLREDMSGIDSSTLRQLTYEGRNYFPAWSPSGDLIAFDSNREGSGYKVWIRDSASGNFLRKICGERNPDWAPSGDRIVYQGPPAGTGAEYEIWVIDTTSTDSQRISSFSEGYSPRDPAWSPDGEWIGYTVYGPGLRMTICITRADGSEQRELIEFNLRFDDSWTPAEPGGQVAWLDSYTLIFSAPDSEATRVVLWKINIDGTGLEQITF